MTIRQQSLPGDLWLVTVNGRLDQNITPALEEALNELLHAGSNRLIIDLSEATYINSGGLRCLVAAWRKARQQGGDVYLCGLRARVAEVFSMVGFDKVFSVYPTRREAASAWQEAS
jgi:anti-sigma B factor antagonist